MQPFGRLIQHVFAVEATEACTKFAGDEYGSHSHAGGHIQLSPNQGRCHFV